MSGRHSSITRERIDYSMWLVLDDSGGARMSRGQPSLKRGERMMQIVVGVPRTLFRTPQLSAKIEIADPGKPTPTIDVAAAESALRQVVGCDVQITVTQPE